MGDVQSMKEIEGGRGSYQGMVYMFLVILGLLALVPLLSGGLTVTSYFGLLFGLAFVGLFVTNLRIFIIVYVAARGLMEFFLEPTRIPIGGSSVQMIGLLGAAILFGGVVYIVMNDIRIYEISVVGPMIIFLAVSLPATILLSPDKVVGIKDWVGTASTVVLFILIAALFDNRKYISILIGSLMLSVVPAVIVGFYQLSTGTGNLETEGFNRIYSTFSHPNTFAGYLVMLLLLCIPLMIEEKRSLLRIGYLALIISMLLSLVFTYARAPWFQLVIGLTIIAAVRYRKMLLLLPVLMFALLIFIPSIIERFYEAFGFSQGQGSLYFRYKMTRYLLPNFLDSAFVGNGLGSFSFFAQEGLGYFYLPHNDYVRLLIDTGIVGLLSFATAFYGLARGSVRSYNFMNDERSKVLALVLFSIVVVFTIGAFTENIFRAGTTQTYLWTIAGLVAASVRTAELVPQREARDNQMRLVGMEA